MSIKLTWRTSGTITLRLLTQHISKLKGIVKKKPQRPVSLKSLKKSVEDGALESIK